MTRPFLGRRGGIRIGLLGGSFNPAHAGHLHVCREALKRLRLHQVWFLVAPQNPLKPLSGMASFAERSASVEALGLPPRARVSDLEARLGTRYTADTLKALIGRYRGVRFVWLMGADSFAELDRWRSWPEIFRRVVIAVFTRSSYDSHALAAKPARRFRALRVSPSRARKLAALRPPAWAFLPGRGNPASASAIRAASGARVRKRR